MVIFRRRLTVEHAAKMWLEHCRQRCEAGLQMEPTTLIVYEIAVRHHILNPEFGIGAIKLTKLTRRDVIAFRDRLLASGVTVHWVHKVFGNLRQMLALADDNELIAHNPAQGIRILRSSRAPGRITIPSKDDVCRLIEAASEDFRPYVIVAALCGMRSSEMRGLPWRHVDFEAGFIRVRQRADRLCNIGEPKTAAGVRDIPMGPLVASTLREWRQRCPRGELDLVFPSNCGTIRAYENLSRHFFKRLCRKVGIKARLHDLRHFAISLWIEQGLPPKAIMEFAGHSSINISFGLYGHLFPSPDHHTGMAEIETRLFG